MPELDAIDDATFFRSIGFDTIHSIDVSEYEGSLYIHDMNLPVPESFYNKYDLIYDGGTSEHVFHFPNVLANIHKMLKVGGRIIHDLPTHNFVNYGFYMYSPTVFCDYYYTNRYTISSVNLIGHQLPYDRLNMPLILEYNSEELYKLSHGGFSKENMRGCEMFRTFFSAVKTEESVSGLIPQQGLYKQIWSTADNYQK